MISYLLETKCNDCHNLKGCPLNQLIQAVSELKPSLSFPSEFTQLCIVHLYITGITLRSFEKTSQSVCFTVNNHGCLGSGEFWVE
jgi:hypothetical protein